jgi:hypothetical protein
MQSPFSAPAKESRVSLITKAGLRGRLIALFRLLEKRVYVLCRNVRPSPKDYLRSHYILGESTPYGLLRECLLDIRTALHRIGRRIDKLPFVVTCSVGPAFQPQSKGNWTPNTRTRACMTDMQHFESQFPTATSFDWELFVTGWQAGAEWYARNHPDAEHEENTCFPPTGEL